MAIATYTNQRESEMYGTDSKHYSVEGNVHQFTFDNWYDYIALAETGETTMTERASRKEYDDYSSSWTLGSSWENAIELGRFGWQAGTDQLTDSIKSFESVLPSHRVRLETSMDITGPGVLDFGRWATGHPEAWIVQQETEINDPHAGDIIRIVFNISASSGVESSEMLDKGATIVGLIDLLERSGKRVELDLVHGTRPNNISIRVRVRVKEANAPIDIERIAFALAHPASFRRIGFSIWEQAAPAARKACSIPGGYGRCEDWAEPDALYVPSSDMANFRDEARRVAWVTEQLTAQGVTFDT